MSSHLHLLPVGSFLARAPEGYSARQRVPLEGVDLDTLDAEVKAVGGWKEHRDIQSSGQRPRRRIASPQRVYWYVIPDAALERP